jgi:flagellar biosynthesis/type III secretory pathway protein FliH
MIRIKVPDDVALPVDGIVKADLLARLMAADKIEQSARDQVERERTLLLVDVENAGRIARQDGYVDGLRLFADAVQMLSQCRNNLYEHVDNLLRDALNHILGQLPAEELLQATLGAVLGKLREGMDVVIMIHPDKLTALMHVLDNFKSAHNGATYFRSEPNPEMGVDECLNYAAPAVIDVSVSVMVDEMVAALHSAGEKGKAHAC